ncbi:restriction endonuclease-like protein [Metabacillus sp. FJAT-53654]|uniref:Restriction endonuclease-like protein n=1 Tax=Metabacillus rhizosphaerae TaxID=3117747 RepID=A0ABZ2MPE0_9BACI
MALHPSGLPNEVELLIIDTDEFTLILKGKPFHERYEGLSQYRQLDFHDEMNLTVTGTNINSVRVFDVTTQAMVEPSSNRPIFFENGNYQLVVTPKTDENYSFYHEHPLLRKAIGRVNIMDNRYLLMGNLQFQNEVGSSTFEIRKDKEKFLEVTIEIFPTKLDYKEDYKRLLDEVNDEIYNLAFHFIKKTYLTAKINVEGKPSRSEFFRLLNHHFGQLMKSIKQIERQPHHKLITTHIKTRGDQLGRIDQTGRKYLNKRPNLFVEVKNGIELHNRSVMPISGLKIKKELTYNTLENQFIKWIMLRLKDRIQDLHDKIQALNHRFEREQNDDLIESISTMIKDLDQQLKNPFWRLIGKLDRSVMSLVIQMAPGYRDVFQTYLILSKGLSLQGNLYQMSVKDVATMYEYWTFIKLGQILGKKYDMISQDIIKVNREGLFVNLDTNSTAKRVYRHPITKEQITLTYQKTERKLPTISQKPDTTLSIEKKGKDFDYNYIFDAKYRIEFAVEGSYYQRHYQKPGPMEEDINTMHRYRDSLVVELDGPFERTAFGAYVLFPWKNEEEYEDHHFYKSINKVNIGGLPFLPNATRIVEQFVEHLIEKSPEDIQQEGILPRGTKESWISSLDEKVLVGMVPTEENYLAHHQHLFYHLPTNRLKKGWQEAKYIALYAKSGAAPQNGISWFGKIINVQIVKRNQITEIPKESSEEFVRFDIEVWQPLKAVIKPVGYGISVYTVTNINTLKQALELPEIFMKSKEEMTLWRMLRRISDNINLELDNNDLDKATKINRFQIKDITFEIDFEGANIKMVKGSLFSLIDIEDVLKQPSSVFKKIIKYME